MPPTFNHLLADLPKSELEILSPHMQLTSLVNGRTLFFKGQVPQHIYFPVGAIVSMMNDLEDGSSIEICAMDRSNVVGIGVLGQSSFYRAQVTTSGLAFRMSASAMLSVRNDCPRYLERALASSGKILSEIAQTLTCFKLHSIEQQLVRWILMTQDRTQSAVIRVTHKDLADILGCRREAITLNLGNLGNKGSININRGTIKVLDRPRLEHSCCECYRTGIHQTASPSRDSLAPIPSITYPTTRSCSALECA